MKQRTPEEQDGIRVLQEAYARWEKMDDVAIVLGRVGVHRIVLALQLASRHPGVPHSARDGWIDMGHQLTEHLSDDAEIYALTMAGWNVMADVPPPPACAVNGCGKTPAAHAGFVLGHQYLEVTEVQSAPPAGATVAACRKCGRTFREDGKFLDSAAQYEGSPFCKTCVSRCHDTEIADHWCDVDTWHHNQPSGMPVRESHGYEVVDAEDACETGEAL